MVPENVKGHLECIGGLSAWISKYPCLLTIVGDNVQFTPHRLPTQPSSPQDKRTPVAAQQTPSPPPSFPQDNLTPPSAAQTPWQPWFMPPAFPPQMYMPMPSSPQDECSSAAAQPTPSSVPSFLEDQ